MSEAVETRWADWMRRANAGDARAYRALLSEVAPFLRAVVKAKARQGLSQDADVEDIVQEVLLAVHLKRHTWREDEPLRPWLFAIARYKVIDAFRVRGRRTDIPIDDLEDALAAPEEEDATMQGDLERVLKELDERSRIIVRAIGLDGASIAETGARLNMTEGAVRVALHRGLKKLASLRARMIE